MSRANLPCSLYATICALPYNSLRALGTEPASRFYMGRVAIIDDSVDTLELLQFILKDHHEFVTFTDAAGFLAQFRAHTFDLILLDLVMPRMDGFEVLRKIREKDQSVPVVAVSAEAHPAERERALRAGFCDYFVKPIMQIELFRDAVYKHVGRCANPPYDKTA